MNTPSTDTANDYILILEKEIYAGDDLNGRDRYEDLTEIKFNLTFEEVLKLIGEHYNGSSRMPSHLLFNGSPANLTLKQSRILAEATQKAKEDYQAEQKRRQAAEADALRKKTHEYDLQQLETLKKRLARFHEESETNN